MTNEEQTLPKKKGISILNWMGTMVLTALPGVNIVFFILTLVLSKSRAKRSYAWAGLILVGAIVVLTALAFILFGDNIVEFAKKLNETAN